MDIRLSHEEFVLRNEHELHELVSQLKNEDKDANAWSFPRIAIDPQFTIQEHDLRRLLAIENQRFAIYISRLFDENSGTALLGLSGNSLARIFIFDDLETTHDTRNAMEEVIAAHRVPEISSIVFDSLPVARCAKATRFDLPDDLPQTDVNSGRVSNERRRIAALEAADLLLSEIESEINELCEDIEGISEGTIWAFWARLAPLTRLSKFVLAQDAPASEPFLINLLHFERASLQLQEAINDLPPILKSDSLDFSLPKEAGNELTRHSDWLSELENQAQRWMRQFATEPATEAFLPEPKIAPKGTAWRTYITQTEFPTAREESTKLCFFLRLVVRGKSFRRSFLRILVKCVQKNYQGISSSSVEFREIFKEKLRPALAQSFGEKVILAIPARIFQVGLHEAMRSWVEQMLGKPFLAVSIQGSECWLYQERAIARTKSTTNPKHFETTLPPLQPVSTVESVREREGAENIAPTLDISSSDSLHFPCPACNSNSPALILDPPITRLCPNKGKPPLTCPECGRLNTKDWWLCWKHGKDPVPVPIDKVRCPDCILRHHEDPEGYPLSSISTGPRFDEPYYCPHCERIHHDDPHHRRFKIPKELIRFYHDGVNGHDSERFRELAKQAKLLDDCRCPACGTLLIPFHHKAGRAVPSATEPPGQPEGNTDSSR